MMGIGLRILMQSLFVPQARVHAGGRFRQRDDNAATEHTHGSEGGLRQH